MLGLLLAAVALEPTTSILLDEAERAMALGDQVTARRKLAEASVSDKKDTEAMRQRVAAHRTWDDCIKSEAARIAHLQEPLETLAEAVLGMCSDQETLTRLKASDVARRLEGLQGAELGNDVEATLSRWRQIQKQTALAILARARLAR